MQQAAAGVRVCTASTLDSDNIASLCLWLEGVRLLGTVVPHSAVKDAGPIIHHVANALRGESVYGRGQATATNERTNDTRGRRTWGILLSRNATQARTYG